MIDNIDFDECLISGGDHRLSLVVGTTLNLYGCSPRPIDHISYSSSTASTVGYDAYRHAEIVFNDLDESSDLMDEYQSLRDRLRSYVGLDDTVDIVLGPSGTDMELLSLLASLQVNIKVTNILVARDEVGSGIEYAAKGCHSTTVLPNGESVVKGDCIAGYEEYDIQLNSVPVRDNKGEILPVSVVIDDVEAKIREAVASDRRVLLHLVYRTKTGIVSPCFRSVQNLLKQFPQGVDVVVDACQYRMSNESLNVLLSAGCMVIITGSKFYAGAPFSAALLVPDGIRDRFTSGGQVPSGLNSYFSRSELPIRWTSFDGSLNEHANPGLLLRWETALYEMRSFSGVHLGRFRDSVNLFVDVLELIVSKYDFISIVKEDKGQSLISSDDGVFNQTIQTFLIDEDKLNIHDGLVIYQALYHDLSELFSFDFARHLCHLGQPVKVKKNTNGEWCAALRISLNASFFSEQSGKILEKQKTVLINDLNVIFDKISIIIKNLDEVKSYLKAEN